MDQPGIKYEFEYEGEKYLADIRHFLDLTPEEITNYRVTENTFLVHLFGSGVVKSFEIFINAGDMTMTWRTHSDIFVDPAICEIIGKEIDNLSL